MDNDEDIYLNPEPEAGGLFESVTGNPSQVTEMIINHNDLPIEDPDGPNHPIMIIDNDQNVYSIPVPESGNLDEAISEDSVPVFDSIMNDHQHWPIEETQPPNHPIISSSVQITELLLYHN